MKGTPFAMSAVDVVVQLGTNLDTGLGDVEVQKRLRCHGFNEIPADRPKKALRILWSQFMDPIILILIIAGTLAFFFSDMLEAMAIVVVILISVTIGFFMELQATRSLEALRKMGMTKATVLRNGSPKRTRISQLVPGDLLILDTGDVIPADARVIQVENLRIKESALTGESVPISKHTNILPLDTLMADRHNMVFKGTTVITGSGRAVVTSTGSHTQLGQIQQMGMEAKKERTPLERKLKQLGQWLIALTLIFAVLITFTGYLRGKDLLFMVETGVALAVAAIPEGLPIVATIALAQGMLRLSKRQVIVKELEAVQTLGATDIICTDKTGTLTEDKLKVHTLWVPGRNQDQVYDQGTFNLHKVRGEPCYGELWKAAVLCNNARVGNQGRIHGDSIEVALLDFVEQLGHDVGTLRQHYPELLELPFDAARKLMATVHQGPEGLLVYVKGAFEALAPFCTQIATDRGDQPFQDPSEWENSIAELAAQGLRTLAFAKGSLDHVPKDVSDDLGHLTFLGIIGFMDPARKDVRATMAVYKKAGIKVVMVTGDHPGTSKRIAQEVGMLSEALDGQRVLHGRELGAFGNGGKNPQKFLNASVIARVDPRQKLEIIELYQKNGHIVGMIGDGINDVPALKKADIGIAMGIRGTEAAREVADVILKNDQFTAIELAIRQGRVILQNIRQFVIYLLSCNLAEVLSVGMAALLNLPSPLLPLQILFLNLITDVFPALALGMGEGEADSMEQPPKDPKEAIMTKKDWFATVTYGLCISAAVLGIVIYGNFALGLSSQTINNMAFYTLVLAQLFNVFNMPKPQESFLFNEVTRNPWVWMALILSLVITLAAYLIPSVADALSLITLAPGLLAISMLFALGSLLLVQLLKRLGAVVP